MRIPSYDDLTPSIPDVSAGDVLTSAAGLLPDGGPVAVRAVRSGGPACQLFAALHGGSPERLLTIARDFSPRLERHPGGTIVLDVTGLQRLLGAPPAIAADLAAAGAPRVAVAVSQIAAILLARARAGITVETGQPETALGDVPIAVLQQWLADRAGDSVSPGTPGRRSTRALPSAAGGRAFDVFRRWGLTTLGELAALPAAALSARLGPEGIAMQRLARGIDARPLVPDPGVPRFLDSFELEWPIDTLEPLSFVFARVLDPLAVALERADRGAVAIHLTLRLTDRTSHVRTLQLPVAMRDPRALRTLLLLDLESHPPSAAADVVTIELDPAPARIVQYSLLERAVPSPETLATLMARLGALVGGGRCGSPVLLDTYRPDGFVMAPVSFEEARKTTTPAVQLPTPMPPGVDDQGDSRRMTPLPVDGSRFGSTRSLSESGVGSRELTSERCVLRRFRPPVAVRVAVEAGRPGRIAIDRRGMPGGAVRQAAGPWRTSGGWWEHGRWNRDEWDVALSDGTVGRLFRDRDSGIWFLDGVYD
jgi:protein ImuB